LLGIHGSESGVLVPSDRHGLVSKLVEAILRKERSHAVKFGEVQLAIEETIF
jgi:hypothetical protein